MIQSFNPKAVTDASRYAEIRADWEKSGPELVSHFPQTAPTGAVFHYQPGFLQGGSSLQLRVETSAEEAQEALRRYSERALATARGGNPNTNQDQTKGIPSAFFLTGDTQGHVFPEDYTIIILKAEDRGGKEYPWNHGSSTGVAVSTQRNSIVYWAEDW